MAFKNFEELISSVGKSSNMKCAAVVWPRTENVVNAVRKAVSEGSLKAIVFGIEDELREKFSGIENIEYVDAATDIDAAKLAVKMAGEGKIDLIMKGSLETGTLLKEVVNKETGIPRMLAPDENGERKSAVMQHMMLVEIPGYHKIIGVTDGGMI
ncbi:MAG: hypothetical protein IIX87_01615, partial [Firmicutes bacterium]|nr:hypothetical protein [Bacillota bacterium]